MLLSKATGLIDFEDLSIKKVKYWLPLDLFFVAMLYTGTFSVKHLSVPMITVFKNVNNIAITSLDFLIYRNKVSRGTVISLCLMLVAAVLASKEDAEFSVIGYTWTFFNCAATAIYVLYMPQAMEKTNLSPFGKVFYNNILSLPLLLVLDLVTERELYAIYSDNPLAWDVNLHILLFISGIFGFCLSLTAFRCMQVTSPTTYALVGSLNKIPLTVIGVALFNTLVTAAGFLYLSLSLLAAGIFAYSKAIAANAVSPTTTTRTRFRAETIESEKIPWQPEEVGRPRRRTSSSVRK